MSKTSLVSGLPTSGAKAFYLIDQKIQPCLCIFSNSEDCETFLEELNAMGMVKMTGNAKIASFTNDTAERMTALYSMINGGIDFILTTQETINNLTLRKESFKILDLSSGRNYERDSVIKYLVETGYERVDYVDSAGQYAVRGEIVDAWSPQTELPYRLVFYDDRIESIREFNFESQRSKKTAEKCSLIPAKELESGGTLKEFLPENITSFIDENVPVETLPSWLNHYPSIRIEPLSENNLGFYPVTKYCGNFDIFIRNVREWFAKDMQMFILCSNDGEKKRLAEMLDERNDLLDKGNIEILTAQLNNGFYQSQKKIVVVSFNEIFSAYDKPIKLPKFKSGRVLEGLWEITPGDYVVHEKHGIGKYCGLKQIAIGENKTDYLFIEYRGNDRLFVPVSDFRKVQKYIGIEGKRPRLYSLDTVAWEHAKQHARKGASEMAKKLYQIYTQRKKIAGHSFKGEPELETTLAASFLYEETSDQKRAIEEVQSDMQKPYPMDRLVLGDVGFGKTEIAVRTALKCVIDSKQVALLCPTTVLAEQHYRTFNERLKTFPVNIALLTRFQSKKEQQKIAIDIKKGLADIVIGTHRLLQKDILFKDLGLLLVDDEHRFGVKQKEKIKLFKQNVDVLMLTATPIPRTLSLALSGIRDMSLIETPPEGRLSIETYTGEYDERAVVHAIRNELKRSGQVFYVHNYVRSINARMKYLQKLLPEVRFSIIHGQMKPDEIEKTMLEFGHRKVDCLVATTIIESGLDIPNANTIIIEKAEEFGLAQLYQLRGRVGRSRREAYCYLSYSSGNLTEVAEKRLSAIQEFTCVGSGYRLALRDLEIRGAGEVLGSQQHGFIVQVGLDLYAQFISKEIANLKGEELKEEVIPKININLPAYLPEEYIPQDDIRVLFYRKFLSVNSNPELEALKNELLDRFGRFTEPVEMLGKIVELQLSMKKLGINELNETGTHIEIIFKNRAFFSDRMLKFLIDKFGYAVEFINDENGLRIIKSNLTEPPIQFLQIFFNNIAIR